jgi:hypothetical protein
MTKEFDVGRAVTAKILSHHPLPFPVVAAA